MVWILNCSFKFSTSTLEFYSWIHIIGKRFYTCLLAFELNSFIWPCSLQVHFQLNRQILIHCYFLLVLMPETVLCIWMRCQFCIRFSLAAFRQSPCQISNSTSFYIFNSIFEFLLMLLWSLVETKEAFVGVGDGDRSTSFPGSFVHHALWKKESVGYTRLPPQAKILPVLLKHKSF